MWVDRTTDWGPPKQLAMTAPLGFGNRQLSSWTNDVRSKASLRPGQIGGKLSHRWTPIGPLIRRGPFGPTTSNATTAPISGLPPPSTPGTRMADAWHLMEPSQGPSDGGEGSATRPQTSEHPPPPLPPPPPTSSFGHVIPYLLRLMFGERHLLWRIGLSVGLMCLSKLCGEWRWAGGGAGRL